MSHAVFFFQAAADTSAGDDVVLDGAEGRHAGSVKRLRVDEAVILTDGRGVGLDARVAEVGRREVRFVVERVTVQAPASTTVTVVQALAKGDRGERAVELLTEVGVSRIMPWQAERSVSHWSAEKAPKALARWQTTAAAAAKQSRRLWWPEVTSVHDSPAVATAIGRSARGFVLHEDAEISLVDELDREPLPAEGDVVLVVGPEGGVSPAELETFAAAGAVALRLGPTVLRTSTAGAVAATLVMARTDEWRSGSATPDQGAARD